MEQIILSLNQNIDDCSPAEKTRLDKFIMSKIHALSEDKLHELPNMSRAFCQKLITRGCVSIANTYVRDPSFMLVNCVDEIVIKIPSQSDETQLQSSPMELDIIYEDDDILVINKPVGLVVHPGAGVNNHTLANGLVSRYGDSLPIISGTLRPGIVHRLDKDTSGLMVIAKTEIAFVNLTSQFSTRSLSRLYQSCVWGVVNPAVGEIEGNIARSRHNRQKMCVAKAQGKPALTKYCLLDVWNNSISLVQCRLESGRTHQIRVHMHHINHPVLGDTIYGSVPKRYRMKSNDAIIQYLKENPGQILHAKELSLTHPTDGKKMTFKTPLPKVFEILKSLL